MNIRLTKSFYGWIIVTVAALVAFSSGPGQSYTFSVFIDSMIAEFNLSRTDISGLYAIGTGISAAMVMVVSRLADKYGPKAMIIVTVSCLTLSCMGMAFVTGGISFFLAFAGLRAFGQGSIPINATLITAQWFVRMRGRAMAVMGLGFASSMAFMPILARALIDNLSWRVAYVVIGILIWMVVVPVSAYFLRNTPEEMNLYPDGSASPPEGEIVPDHIVISDRRKVLTSVTFWGLAVPLSVPGFVSTALVFHQSAIFVERGMSLTMAASVFLPISASALAASILSGFLVDKIGPRTLFYISTTILLTSICAISIAQSLQVAIVYAVILGASNGTGQIVSNVLWAHYYGRQGLGRIQGSASMVMIAASAIGPLPLAIMHAITGRFTEGILLMCALPISAVIIMAAVKTDNIQRT